MVFNLLPPTNHHPLQFILYLKARTIFLNCKTVYATCLKNSQWLPTALRVKPKLLLIRALKVMQNPPLPPPLPLAHCPFSPGTVAFVPTPGHTSPSPQDLVTQLFSLLDLFFPQQLNHLLLLILHLHLTHRTCIR